MRILHAVDDVETGQDAHVGKHVIAFIRSHDGVWSPDGRSIAFESDRNGDFDIFVKPSNGATAEQPLREAPDNQWPITYSSDGKFLLYYDATKRR